MKHCVVNDIDSRHGRGYRTLLKGVLQVDVTGRVSEQVGLSQTRQV